VGIQTFYVTLQQDSGGQSRKLLTNPIPSRNVPAQRFLDDGSSFSIETNTFSDKRTIRGKATVSCALNKLSGNLSFSAHLEKFDGDSSVDISNTVTSATGDTADYAYTFDLDITTTKFKKGDILRLVIVTGESGGSGLWADPIGSGNHIPFKLLVPFDPPQQ